MPEGALPVGGVSYGVSFSEFAVLSPEVGHKKSDDVA
jgi:hypothetical protein